MTSAGDRARLATYMEAHPALSHEKGGVPDLVINNAGVCIRQHDGEGEGKEAYEKSLAVNTWGPVRLLAEACLPRMRRRGCGCTLLHDIAMRAWRGYTIMSDVTDIKI